MDVVVVSNCLSVDELDALRCECDLHTKLLCTEDYVASSCAIDLFETAIIGDDHPSRSNLDDYFQLRWRNSPQLSESNKIRIQNILLRKFPWMIVSVLKASQLYLFNEHYVVKPPHSEISFRWHTDFEEQLPSLLPELHEPYLSIWCPLDDVTTSNGTLIIPRQSIVHKFSFQMDSISNNSHLKYDGLSNYITHTTCHDINLSDEQSGSKETETAANEEQEDKGTPLCLPFGSIVIFSSHMLHCSLPNQSSLPRRVFYAQYSQQVISSSLPPRTVTPLSTLPPSSAPAPLCFAIPCDTSSCYLLDESDNPYLSLPISLGGKVLPQGKPYSTGTKRKYTDDA
jgi:hypothetical protein